MTRSELDLNTIAAQWVQLCAFGSRLPVWPAHERAEEAARFLRYHHELDGDAWRAVERLQGAGGGGDTALPPAGPLGRFCTGSWKGAPSEAPEWEAGLVAAQWRLLFAFGAQFTLHADLEAEGFLRRAHGLGDAEWELVRQALRAQEETAG